jgi:hypothetical protein
MPVEQDTNIEFSKSLEAAGETTGTTVKLTGDSEVDNLLQLFSTSKYFDLTMAYVYGNLTARPKLKVSEKKRAVYAVKGANFYYEYSLTDLDIAWLARSLKGEGISSRNMASVHTWIMFNRFMLNPNWHVGMFKDSFWRYILFFSQPVNPRWRRTGEFCKVGGKHYNTLETKGKYKGQKKYCSERQLKRRDDLAFGPIPADSQAYAEDFAIGQLAPPNKVYINFGDTGRDWTKLGGEKVGAEVVYPLATSLLEADIWDTALKGTKKTAQVIFKTLRAAAPEDIEVPLKSNVLIAYVKNALVREQQYLAKQKLAKGNFNIAAQMEAQSSANSKGQQIANTVQTVTAMKNATSASPVSPVATSPNGQQVCSDDTWNYV